MRGISELRILQIIMGRLKARLGLPDDADDPLPCDYFQLIGGTSTGGLIAIMLSRLRMTAVEAAEQYNALAKEIFGPKNKKSWVQDGAFKATTLKKAVERSQTLKLKKIHRWRPGRQAQDREEWERSNLEDEWRFESQQQRIGLDESLDMDQDVDPHARENIHAESSEARLEEISNNNTVRIDFQQS